MKSKSKLMKFSVLFVLFSCFSSMVFSQKSNDSVSVMLKKAFVYKHGINCSIDDKKAYRIYNKLAALGSPEAMYQLGRLYLKGEGVVQNYDFARGFFKMASDRGISKATSALALMYHKGEGVKSDFRVSYQLYVKAASQGEPSGC